MSNQFQNPQSSQLGAVTTEEILTTSKQIEEVKQFVSTVIKGKESVIQEVIMALCSNGHVLLKDIPGVGKTLLAKTLALAIEADFKRIQFTPDLLPSDIMGVNIFNQKSREFQFHQGPVFTNILLADEINRSTPKTQSALLEAMEERQVSVDNNQYKLEELFFVIATKNPIEHSGTYPLPTAQLDRFCMQLSIGYPDKDTEIEILRLHTGSSHRDDKLKGNIVTKADVLKWQETSLKVYVSPIIDSYIVDLARQTRLDSPSGHGVSPRAAIQLKRVAMACAMIDGRDYVVPEDIHRVIKQVFVHRFTIKDQAGESFIEEILTKVTI